MAGYKDAMAVNALAVCAREKKRTKELQMEQCDSRLTASVSAGIFRIEVPEKKINISFRLQDVMTVIQAANGRYLEQK